ncbi:MAG: Thiopurine S-methyltransferase [Ignavibacteria bacterium]|nr:Thiopurine S-methyltransferase [Ignavibacteria bacterium]
MGVVLTPIFFMDKNFWNSKYINGTTGWDIGYVSTPLKEYFDQLDNKGYKILIPGAGNGYEASYLLRCGFKNIHILDISEIATKNFIKRNPDFPVKNIHTLNFFDFKGEYDLIIEQTFFCALNPDLRWKYVEKMFQLLKPGGKLVGLLFDDELNSDHPPFGGSKNEYEELFKNKFSFKVFSECFNSIPPRQGRELFINLVKVK